MKSNAHKKHEVRNVLSRPTAKVLLATSILFAGVHLPTHSFEIATLFSIQEAQALELSLNKIEMGTSHTFGLLNGNVLAWGNNSYGQLGIGSKKSQELPIGVNSLTHIMDVSAGESHSIFLKEDGTLMASGYNNSGALGDGTFKDSMVPVQVKGIARVDSVKTGANHNVALKTDRTVWTWGENGLGQLGNGTYRNNNVPAEVVGLTNVIRVEAGNRHNLAKKADGSLWAWGANDSGQLGNGKIDIKGLSSPIKIPINDVVDFAMGTKHSVAVKADGTVWSWGANGKGELGLGNNNKTNLSSTPMKVPGLTDIIKVVAGKEHTLTLKKDGTVWAWGANDRGQIGNGTTKVQQTPIKVSGLSDIISIQASVNGQNSFAVNKTKNVYVWGFNGLINGTNTQLLSPMKLDGIKEIGEEVNELEKKLQAAKKAVGHAETEITQVSVNDARNLVDEIPNSTNKNELSERLNVVQEKIDEKNVLAELLKNAIKAVEKAEDSEHQLDVTNAWPLVLSLPSGIDKTNLTVKLNAVQKLIEQDQMLSNAIKSVENAEKTLLQEDVDASRSLVNRLEDGLDKERLNNRLDLIQAKINKAIETEKFSKAKEAVEKAERTKLNADAKIARVLVNELNESDSQKNFSSRLDAVEYANSDEARLKNAQKAVLDLTDNSTKGELDTAISFISQLPDSLIKVELFERVTAITQKQKAIAAVNAATELQTNYNIVLAEKAIILLPDGSIKENMQKQLEFLKLSLDAEIKVGNAERTKREAYILDALESVSKLPTSEEKNKLELRIQTIQEALSKEIQASLLLEVQKSMGLAQQYKRDPYIKKAQEMVASLQDSLEKTAFLLRLQEIVDNYPDKSEEPKENPALLKAAETQVGFAERYQREPYLTRAQEAINSLSVNESKSSLQDRLNLLLNEASEKIEAEKRQKAIEAITKAEKASDLSLIEEARGLVNEIKDAVEKTILLEHIEAIEVTESMRFAYELKRKIETVNEASVKQKLQDAYEAVGVAKERQSATYMNRAMTSIGLVTPYSSTHGALIAMLSTYFDNMQEEVEVQKFVGAADKAVQLSEKYQRATYYIKAQAAIDVLPEGKSKKDLQVRLDVVMN